MNYGAYNYVYNAIFNNVNKQDLWVIYKYLTTIEAKDMTIWECMKQAQKFVVNESRDVEKEKLAKLQVKDYSDYSLEELWQL